MLPSFVFPSVPAQWEWLSTYLFDSSSWALLAVAIFLLLKFLRCFSEPTIPRVFMGPRAGRMHKVMKGCDALSKVYRPPRLWGRSGHLQTVFYGFLGHASLKKTFDRRHRLRLPDGATVTFDVFEPHAEHNSGRDYTLLLCPGIANSSESNYIRTCVHYAVERGYRCAVLNHLGALKNVPLTSARIFSYGSTEELSAMTHRVAELYPNSKFIPVGFSMGANLTTLFMGRLDAKLKARIVGALAVGQPYDAIGSIAEYQKWEGGRRIYNYLVAENMKRVLRRHYDVAVRPHVQSGLVDEQKLWHSTVVVGVDEFYQRRVQGYSTVEEYYHASSSINHLHEVQVPIVFVNAMDDPIVPPSLWMPARDKTLQLADMAFITTKHGGHLGYLEGHSLNPSSITWIDRFIVQLADEFINVYDSKNVD